MDFTIIESCHSTWIFDLARLRYCRVLKGIEVSHQPVHTDWRPYELLETDPMTETFCVWLNSSGSRRIRSWRHTPQCTQCRDHDTSELSLSDIREALRV
jgi:hypothetical protein